MRTSFRFLVLLVAFALGLAPSSRAQFIIYITSNNSITAALTSAPTVPLFAPAPITGLASGQTIAGVDYRPRTGELFALGYNPTNGESRLYTLNQTTGVATPVGAANITLNLGTTADSIGFDFNPTVDLIRIVAANRMNYRVSPVTGAIAATDGMLTYATGDANAASTPRIGASAYSNSYVASEATTLYNIDQNLNILTTQNPPNNGTQNTVGSLNITSAGALRSYDLDIAFDSTTATNRAFLSRVTTVGILDTTKLYTVNLATGATTLVGPIGTGLNIKDIAVFINRSIPATVTGQLVYGLTRVNRNMFTFDSQVPGIIRKFAPITGVVTGQRIVGMDVRPADRRLYALGYDTLNSSYTLYTIDTATAAATAVNATAGTIALGPAMARIGFDFNPTVDRIRVTSSNGANLRLNPNDGAVAATDGALTYVAGDVNAGRPSRVGSVAYTNSFNNATGTTLFAIDDSLGALLVVDTPNGGKLRTLANTFFAPNQADPTNDLDIFYDSTNATNTAYFAVNTGSSANDSLWMFSAASGTTAPQLMPVGKIGLGVQVMDIAVQSRYTGTTSVSELSAVPGVDVYPNPAGETLFVRTPGSGDVRAMLTDLQGRVVLTAEGILGTELRLQVGTLPAGTYALRLESGGKILGAAKVVKQ